MHNETCEQLTQCFGCSELIHPNSPLHIRDVPGFLDTHTRHFCSRDCAERDEEREQEPTKEYIE